jgi:hypothetical protein
LAGVDEFDGDISADSTRARIAKSLGESFP